MCRTTICVLVAVTLAACASPTRPSDDEHWTLHVAYSIEVDAAEMLAGFQLNPVRTEESSKRIVLRDQPFAFQWRDYEGPTMVQSFTLREDGTAVITRLEYYEGEHEGQRMMLPKHVKAAFDLAPHEHDAIRRALQQAEAGNAPAAFWRDGIYDGLSWQMSLRADGRTKGISFSNAVPVRFRQLMVTIFRDVCAAHAHEIDQTGQVEGFPELAGADLFKE